MSWNRPLPAEGFEQGTSQASGMTVDQNQARKSLIAALAARVAKWRQAAGARPVDQDPYLGAKAAGREIYLHVRGALDMGDSRLHARSLLCALGAVAGHACQASVRAQSVAAGEVADAPFDVIQGADGRRYLSGDAMNGPLAEHKMSVWNLAAGAAQLHGTQSLPNLAEIFEYNASVVGTQKFGLPRLPPDQPVSGMPIEFAKRLWPAAQASVNRHAANPKLWPIAAALAVQEAIAVTKEIISPEIALRIVMESAIPVSKIPIES
jgi:hypothetical protein